ncbi:aldehyde dehydrogenase family protein [Sphingobium phenoxybenzoativorans]|uniref:aldehyde dehydrogenase (NAD(+)) n=1 Tax=Sphingobium phenoxybenzoativorans TaxID=1592790 RepID=A0A975Q173_9SPHN|nr:aldehyde dehydrogenase family protein [Sphingobium phenoxybenzoativorans]QUT05499.1 aldehyde dehydrogenase family protein [Sphingobium phenoxybenzoativorans]
MMNASDKQIDGLRFLLAGKLTEGADTVDVENPSTNALIARAPQASHAQLDNAIAAAMQASGWAADEVLRRAALRTMSEMVNANRDTLARTLSLEIGLPFKAAQDEISASAAFLLYRADAETPLDVLHDDARQRVEVVRKPIGVVGAIIPWNAPMLIACEKIATAFAVGNTVVMKPSPLAPLTLLQLGELISDVVPPGVLSILPGGAELGTALVAHPQVGMISFTGSIRAGQAIMANAAPGLKRLSLELGGNDAAIVLPDADVASVAPRLFTGAFYRSGQVCAAIKRLYVHRDIAAPLTEALRNVAEAAVLGDPFDPAVTLGPLSNRQQFEIVKGLVDAAVRQGGSVVTGGSPLNRPGNFFRPTLITDVDETNPLVQEEQFGPALPIISYDSVDEAVARANDTRFGLGGSVWTSDVDTGSAVARRIQSGSVWVNRHGLVLPDVPFGGMKLSGLGRANGNVGFDSYAELQTVSVAKPREAKSR